VETNNATASRPLLLKVPDACDVLGISRSQLYILRRDGEITFVTIGPRQVRVPYAECEAWLARKLAGAQAQTGQGGGGMTSNLAIVISTGIVTVGLDNAKNRPRPRLGRAVPFVKVAYGARWFAVCSQVCPTCPIGFAA
jgi:excisionase family DNA binding protein